MVYTLYRGLRDPGRHRSDRAVADRDQARAHAACGELADRDHDRGNGDIRDDGDHLRDLTVRCRDPFVDRRKRQAASKSEVNSENKCGTFFNTSRSAAFFVRAMMHREVNFKTMNLAIRLVVAAGLLLFYTACPQITDHDPSDAELLRNFAVNRETLDSLVTMCQEDPQMIRIAPEFTWKKDNVAWPRPDSELGITKERWDFYRELFTKAKIKGGLLNYQPDSIMMVVSTRGAANS